MIFELVIDGTKITVKLDGKPLGVVQDIKIHAEANSILPTVEITFPELPKNHQLSRKIENQIEELKKLPYVSLKKIAL